MDHSISQPVIHWNKIYSTSIDQYIIGEEPLSIRVQGNPYSVVMRSPGDEIPHVAGFCLGEGIVDKPDDLVKTHKEPVAYLGGIGILIGLTVGVLMSTGLLGGQEFFADILR